MSKKETNDGKNKPHPKMLNLAPKIRNPTEHSIRHVARISSRRGPTWRGPRVPPTKKRKLLGYGPLFFGSGPIHFFTIQFYFIFPLREGGMAHLAPLWLRPCILCISGDLRGLCSIRCPQSHRCSRADASNRCLKWSSPTVSRPGPFLRSEPLSQAGMVPAARQAVRT